MSLPVNKFISVLSKPALKSKFSVRVYSSPDDDLLSSLAYSVTENFPEKRTSTVKYFGQSFSVQTGFSFTGSLNISFYENDSRTVFRTLNQLFINNSLFNIDILHLSFYSDSITRKMSYQGCFVESIDNNSLSWSDTDYAVVNVKINYSYVN